MCSLPKLRHREEAGGRKEQENKVVTGWGGLSSYYTARKQLRGRYERVEAQGEGSRMIYGINFVLGFRERPESRHALRVI